MKVTIDGVDYVPRPVVPEMNIHETLSGLLKRTRVASGMTIEQAANLLNMSRSSVWALENSRNEPTLRTAFALAEAYGLPLERLAKALP